MTSVPRLQMVLGRLGDCFQENFHLATSGNFRSPSLMDAILEIGEDGVT